MAKCRRQVKAACVCRVTGSIAYQHCKTGDEIHVARVTRVSLPEAGVLQLDQLQGMLLPADPRCTNVTHAKPIPWDMSI